MKILILSIDPFGANGGIAKYNDNLLEALSKSSNLSEITVLSRKKNRKDTALPEKISYISHSSQGIFSYTLASLIAALNFRKHFDLVICAHINLLPLASLIAKTRKIPLWTEIYGIDAWEPHRLFWVNWLIKYSSFITISQFTKQRFIQWSGVSPEKVRILPPCFDGTEFEPGPKPTYLVERYGLEEKTVLLTLGRLDPLERYKGFDEVIEALPALINHIPNVVYMIAGDGEDMGRIKNKVVSLGLKDRVIFSGFVSSNEKSDHYKLADVFVMPGRGEGFGIVYLEAMACGIPVVASKADGSQDAVRNGELGILVDPDNPDEIVNGILQALKIKTGSPPVGLTYFSYPNFQARVNYFLEQEFVHDQ